MYSKKEREHYNISRERTCNRLGITVNQYNWLRRKGRALRRIFEANCNGEYKTDEQYNLEVNKVKMAIWQYRLKNENIKLLKWYFQIDCRGASIYLDKKAIPENNYTIASCIY